MGWLRRRPGIHTHLGHLEDALWVQTASADLPCAGDSALVCDGHDEARHRARLLLQGRVHYVPVSHLQNIRAEVRRSTKAECARHSLVLRKSLIPWSHLAQRHYTGNILHVESQTVIRVVWQFDFLPSFLVGWYMNSGNPNREDTPIRMNFTDCNIFEMQQNSLLTLC